MQEMGLSYFLSRFVRIIKAVFRGIACLMQGRGIMPHLEYPELYALVGSRTPDFRGLFLRGFGSQASSHYGVVTHASGNLMTIQGDAIRNMTGRATSVEMGDPGHGSWATGVFINDTYSGWEGSGDGSDRGASYVINFDASRAVPTANENRPVNMAT